MYGFLMIFLQNLLQGRKDNNKRGGGVWRLTINKSQTEFENFRQVLKEILFLKYIHTPPPSLEKRSH